MTDKCMIQPRLVELFGSKRGVGDLAVLLSWHLRQVRAMKQRHMHPTTGDPETTLQESRGVSTVIGNSGRADI
jgi:hypothetical protein